MASTCSRSASATSPVFLMAMGSAVRRLADRSVVAPQPLHQLGEPGHDVVVVALALLLGEPERRAEAPGRGERALLLARPDDLHAVRGRTEQVVADEPAEHLVEVHGGIGQAIGADL